MYKSPCSKNNSSAQDSIVQPFIPDTNTSPHYSQRLIVNLHKSTLNHTLTQKSLNHFAILQGTQNARNFHKFTIPSSFCHSIQQIYLNPQIAKILIRLFHSEYNCCSVICAFHDLIRNTVRYITVA